MMKKAKLSKTVKAARSGDKAAVEELYNLYRQRLWFFICKNITSKQAAEDIVSDSFLTAIEKLDELRCDEAFGSWLYSIAYRKCLQHTKAEADIARFDDDKELESSMDNLALNEPIMLPSDHIENEEIRQQLRDAIESLKPDLRSAVIMYYFEEMSVAEVGRVLGVNENAAKQKLFRARKKLFSELKDKFKSSSALCVIPLGAALRAAFPKGISAAAKSGVPAVKAGIITRIAGVSLAAAVAVGAPIALSSYYRGGDYRSQENIVSQQDSLKDEACGFLEKLVGKSFDYTYNMQPELSVDSDNEAKNYVFVDTQTSEQGTAEDAGIPRLFINNKDSWKISVCSDDHESGVFCTQMRFTTPATSVKLYCPPADYSDENVTYRLYIPKTPYQHTDGCKYIRIELQQPKSDVPLQDRLNVNRKSGTDYKTEQALAVTPATDNRICTSCAGIYSCDISYCANEKLDIRIIPDTNILQDTNGYYISAAACLKDSDQSAVSLLYTSDDKNALVAQDGDYHLFTESSLTGYDSRSGTNSCWNIHIESIPPTCDRVRLNIIFTSHSESAKYNITFNISIPRASDNSEKAKI